MAQETSPVVSGRMLAPSEALHAEPAETVAYTVVVQGPLQVLALSRAFEASCRAHPVFTARLRSGAAGNEIVVADHSVPAVRVRAASGEPVPATRRLNHDSDLVGLEVSHAGDRAAVTLLTDHCVADAAASVALLAELWGHYTDILATGQPTLLPVSPVPRSLESLLAHRGVPRRERHGMEALFEPAQPSNRPEPAPSTAEARGAGSGGHTGRRIRLTAGTTSALARLGRAGGVSIHGLISAVVMIAHAEAGADGVEEMSVPLMYPVDVRSRISPPVDPLDGTNIFGTVGFKRSVGIDTDPLQLARDLLGELHESIREGVVQQAQLHLTGRDGEAADGPAMVLSPDTVLLTNWGRIPELRTPSDLTVEDFRGAILQQPLRPAGATDSDEPPAPTSTYIVTTCKGRLSVELTTAHPAAQADAIVSAMERLIGRLAG
ncbi:hypothetical protein ABH931_004167 [Streptacidiphilus sp. MAP12-33]|uniref:phthiocerol/phthiodiolone dimycocerosyl transferase family protein n=1 Tax=Streptacidiphilus sp. MAP12-33 TaxID=3156266 RepID=UPI003515C425